MLFTSPKINWNYFECCICTSRAALEPETIRSWTKFPLEPSAGSPKVYWLYNELEKLLRGQRGLIQTLRLIAYGRDAVLSLEDPLPFLATNSVQMMELLARHCVTGARWADVSYVMGGLR